MLESIAIALASMAAGYVIDRVKYARDLARLAAKHAPNKTVQQAAEAAIIEANQREMTRALAVAARERAKHEVRIAAIRNGDGDVNVGNLK